MKRRATLLWAWVAIASALGGGVALRTASSASSASKRVRVRTFHFTDRSRTIRLPSGRRVPRPLTTIVRYAARGAPQPLIVFAHGFALTPAVYGRLLRAWAGAGYVVAAPVFPLENANAPGGATQADLVNEPRDVSFVITTLLALSSRPGSVLEGRIDPSRIAVAGHSDGAVTALAAAYDRRFLDPRVRAAIVLSGARLGGMGPFPPRGPPLLAVQGTADRINVPATTASYFRVAHRPKFLVWLLGASHLEPYTSQEPQLGFVEHATTAFLAHYLKGRPLAVFTAAARRRGVARLVADP